MGSGMRCAWVCVLALFVAAHTEADDTGKAKGNASSAGLSRGERLHAFEKTILVDAYNSTGKHAPWDSYAIRTLSIWACYNSERYLPGRLVMRSYLDDDAVPEAFAAGTRAINGGCNDPLVLYLTAQCEGEPTRQSDMLRRSFVEFGRRDYPAIMKFWCARRLLTDVAATPGAATDPACRQALAQIPSLITAFIAKGTEPDVYLPIFLRPTIWRLMSVTCARRFCWPCSAWTGRQQHGRGLWIPFTEAPTLASHG